MSGRMITLMRKSIWDFSFLGTSGVQTITLKRALPVLPFYYYWFGLRLHNIQIVSGSFVLELPNTLPSSKDPQEFTDTAAPALSITLNNTTGSAPQMITDTTTNLGPYLKFVLRATQGTGGNRLYAEISAVLFGRVP